jgi:hypothetical protein
LITHLNKIDMKKLVLIFLVASVFFACDNDDDMPSTSMMELDFNGLSDLGSDYVYEGWIMVNGAPVSTGTFMANAAGDISPSMFDIDSEDLDAATAFILTIEPSPDNDPAPSDIHVVAGNFSGKMADLSISHPAALGTDFASAMGKYILATPTNGADTNEESGIWFLDLSSGEPMEGLNLPQLPAGWIYEGWTVIDDKPVSTGTFMETSGMVDNFDGYSSQENPGPPFPGEDFLMNAPDGLSFPTDITGGIAVISVEPYPDNGPEPFAIKPLVGMIPADAMDHVTYMMDLNAGSFPTGMAKK